MQHPAIIGPDSVVEMARDSHTVATAQAGEYQDGQPFLGLPAEVRNLIYRHALIENFVVKSLKQPALLCTSKQIRDEALPMYYVENQFIVSIHAQRSRIRWAVRHFVNGELTSIRDHIRHIIIHIHDRSYELNRHHDHLLEFTDRSRGSILASFRVGHPSADWTDYSQAKEDFYNALFNVGNLFSHFMIDSYGNLRQPGHGLFQATWLLAHTFTAATNSVYTQSSTNWDLDQIYARLIPGKERFDAHMQDIGTV